MFELILGNNLFWIVLILNFMIFGISTSYVAGQKGKDKLMWFIVGGLTGIIGLLTIGFAKEENNVRKEYVTKENVQAIAKEIIREIAKEKDNERKYTTKSAKNKMLNLTTDTSSPIDIGWNSIVNDKDNTVLYSSFKNISDKKIKSIIFDIECFNSFGKPISDSKSNVFEKTIQDLSLLPKDILFENLFIDLSCLPTTRKVNIVIKNVLFEDDSIWDYSKENLKDTELHIIEKDLNLIRQYNGNDIISFSEIKQDRWICICARNNGVNEEKCARCSRDKDEIISRFSIDKVDNTIVSGKPWVHSLIL